VHLIQVRTLVQQNYNLQKGGSQLGFKVWYR